MKIELSKIDVEQAVKDYISLWFIAVEVVSVEFIRTKKADNLKVVVEAKKEGDK